MGLRSYILTRILLTIPMIFILLTIVFFVMRILPGNPVLLKFEKNADPALVAEYTHILGLDKPIWQQYTDYVWNLLHGNLGLSMAGTFEPVGPEIMSRFPATLELAIYSTFVAIAVGILLGSFAARRGGIADGVVKVYGIFIYSFPVFFLGMLLQIFFGIWLHLLPVGGRTDVGMIPTGLTVGGIHIQTGLYTIDSLFSGNISEFLTALKYLVLPSISLGLVISGVFVRMTRTNMMETIRS